MTTCIERVRCWMASNCLRLNPTKTELIWLSSPRHTNLLSTSPIRLFGTVIQPSQYVRDLGIFVNSDLSLSAHVSHITSVCFYYLRQLRLVRRSLTMDAAHALVRAMIHSRLESSLLQQSACWSTYWSNVTSTVSFTCGRSTCARPTWSCSSVSSHAWHAPLVEFPAACHVQVMSADIQVSAWSGTRLTCRASAHYWPLFLAVLCYVQLTQTNCWYHGPAQPALDCVPSVLLVRLPGMICRLICATWTYL